MFLRGRLSAQASESIAKNIRDRIYDHIQRLPYKYHKEADTGDLMQRCTSDIDTIRRFLGVQLVEVGNGLSLLLLIATIMFRADRRMALISMAMVPILFTFAVVFFRKVKEAFRETDETEAQLTSVLQENLTGIRVVRAFHNQDYEIKRFTAKNEVHRDKVYRLIWLLACYWSSSDLLAFSQIGLTLVAGAYFTSRGELSIGTLVLFTSYTGMLVWPVRHLGRILTDMGKALVAAERLEEVFAQPQEVLFENHEQPPIRGHVVFENVSFGYEPGQPVLKNVSFTVLPGQTVGILGHTGSGKSSLVQLLARLYDYDQGSIKVDGVELKNIDKRWIRRNVAVVPQEPFLFAKTIRENVTLARGEVPDEELYAVCKEAAIHDVVLSFEQGYETLVGERGVSLSGGQKQRVAIARALSYRPKILLMDEPFGALDAMTRHQMQELLTRIWEQHRLTVMFVTHDIEEAVYLSDRIVVMGRGPGHIKTSFPVELGRPRHSEMSASTAFIELQRQVLKAIREDDPQRV